jgi:hypothetical protein
MTNKSPSKSTPPEQQQLNGAVESSNSRVEEGRDRVKGTTTKTGHSPTHLLDNKFRAQLLRSHPLLTLKGGIVTPAIEAFRIRLRRAILLREPCLCFGAFSGAGKSAALEDAKTYIEREFPTVVCHIYDAQNRQVPSIRAFFQHFLDVVGNTNDRGETFQLRKRLRNHLIDSARVAGGDLVVFLFDEAQALDLNDLKFLKDLSNSLAKEGVQVLTVMVGQEPDFTRFREEIAAERRLDLYSRFLIAAVPFPSLSSVEDFQTLFSNFDNFTYPAGSAWTWTQAFFPEAWLAGFRLRNEANNFVSAVRRLAGSEEALAIPARQAFLAVRMFMADNAPLDCTQMALPETAWSSAIMSANVMTAISLGGKISKKKRKVQL